MTRNQAAKFLNAATHAEILPERKPVDIKEVRIVATIPGVKFTLQSDGSLYVQGARCGYEVK